MSLQIKRATRQGVKPLIGLYAESGCGKTMSALLLARGLVGPSGKIVMIDTESGRGSLYADVIPGGYDVLELRDSFSPARYIEAVQAVEQSGAQVCLIDSVSHEWEGLDGVTDMAATGSRRRADKYGKEWDGVVQFGDWKEPKMEHQKFMIRMLQSPLPIIVCLRAKYKSRQVKGTQEMADAGAIDRKNIGKNVVLKDEFTSPIQAEDFIYEMTAHGEIMPDHSLRLTKCSHPSLRDCFPDGKPITIEHGQKLAQWCAAPGTSPTSLTPGVAPAGNPDLTAAKKELWQLVKEKCGGDKGQLRQYLVDEAFIAPEQPLEDLTASDLAMVIAQVKQKLARKETLL